MKRTWNDTRTPARTKMAFATQEVVQNKDKQTCISLNIEIFVLVRQHDFLQRMGKLLEIFIKELATLLSQPPFPVGFTQHVWLHGSLTESPPPQACGAEFGKVASLPQQIPVLLPFSTLHLQDDHQFQHEQGRTYIALCRLAAFVFQKRDSVANDPVLRWRKVGKSHSAYFYISVNTKWKWTNSSPS